jgi:hypothetical protein
MNIRRRVVLALTSVLALATLVPPMPAVAGIIEQTDDSAVPPVEPVEPNLDEQGNEIVHSWALAPAGSEEAGGVGNRNELTYVADPGSVIEDAVTLFNLSNVPLVFRIYATDAFNNPDGEFDLLAPEIPPTGAGTWVDLGAEQITVDAGTQVTMPITITIPENASAGDHAGAVLASSAAVSTGEDGQQLTLDRRTGTRLYVRVNGPLVPELTIENVDTDYESSINPLGGSATVTYTIENRGNVRLGGTVTASIGGPFGIGSQDADPRVIADLLPGQSVTFEEEFDDVAALGVAVAEVALDPVDDGGATSEPVSRQSWSLALPIVVLLALAAALFGALALRAVRRHQRLDGAVDGPIDTGSVEVTDFEAEHQHT